MTVDGRRIDKNVLKPIAKHYHKVGFKCDPEKWTDYEVQQVRAACGPKWAGIPIENIRLQCCNLRKAGELGTLRESKNHGATKIEKPPTEYDIYLLSAWWKQFRRIVLEWWSYRCCWCNSDLKVEVHHRTYERLGQEKIQDCVCLCRECHKAATRMLQRRARNDNENETTMF